MRILLIFLIVTTSVPLLAQSSKTNIQTEVPDFQCKVRLPGTINSYRPTIQPVLSPDGNRLYFDRKFHPGNWGGNHDCDDIWYSDRKSDGSWGEPVNIGAPLNTNGCDVLFSISPDGHSALVGGVYSGKPQIQKLPGFSLTTWEDGQWQAPTPIVIPDFYNNSGFFYASLSADSKVLLFGISRNGCLGMLDLYYSMRDKAGNWSVPQSLGPTVNSVQYEVSPFLALDGKTLYFSSDRKGGFGKNDLYMTRRLDDTWQNWSEPINLGPAINTIADELSITINAAGDTACIVSADSVNQLEGIYFVCLPKAVRPQKVNLSTIIENSKKERNTTLVLYFSSNEYQLTDSNIEKIKSFANERNGLKNIVITGYADDEGSNSYNRTLSQKRAHSVGKMLRASGVSKMKYIYRGEDDLSGKMISKEEKAQYRKVEITVR